MPHALSITIAAFLVAAGPGSPQGSGTPTPLLELGDAVAAAQQQNHALQSSALELRKVDERSAAERTRRLPSLRIDAVGSRLLEDLDFTFPTGAFGTYPGIGPIPSEQSTVKTKADFTATLVVSAGQPLTQQYRIGLGLEALRLEHSVAEEDLRRDRQRVGAEVRTTYYKLSATEAGIVALRDLVRAIEELDEQTTRYLKEQTVLLSEALEVKARLARERQRLAEAESSLASQREHLNQLMGRDIATPFRVVEASQLENVGALGLDAARELALANRPEVHTAVLRIDQADTARRIARSHWIPDVTLAASYARNVNYDQVVPEQIATAGLALTWEPFDWGRRGHEAAQQAVAKAQAKSTRDETEQQIAVEVGRRWRAVKDAAALLEATRRSEEAASAYLADVRNQYREDATMLQDVLEAEARLSRARHDNTDALAGYWSATAELERTIGHENS